MHALEPAWEALKRDFDSACSRAAASACEQLAHDLNQTSRRLRQYEAESDWYFAVLDGASKFASSVAVFSVSATEAQLRARKGIDVAADFRFPLATAGAFASALETKDPVVALRTAGEVTGALASVEPGARAHLFPIVNAGRVVAVLFAAGDESLNLDALELIGTIASSVLERQANKTLHAQIGTAPATLAAASAPAQNTGAAPATATAEPARTDKGRQLPPWSRLSKEERAVHIKAQRFARVAVAEMQLARPEASRAGREQRNLYVFLKPEIDKARETYRRQFMTNSLMIDYLHHELVRTAAAGDEQKLGADYPGQLL